MARVWQLLVRASGDTAGAQRSLVQLANRSQRTGRNIAASGRVMTRGLTIPLIAMGGFAVKASLDVDKAMATIRTGTGATGEGLADLETSFKNIARTTPSGFDDIATAVAEVNTRVGLTGKPLEDMSRQLLNLSRITGVEVSESVRGATRVFGDWGVAVGDQSDAMDFMFKTTQQTGIGMDRLQEKVVQFGAPMRQLGFTFDESTALLGKWEKEGVNTERVLGSLSIGVGRLAREGVKAADMGRVFRERLDDIKSSADPVGDAIELFGARAGPDMAAAIKEGRFSVEDLMVAIDESGDTINVAAGEAETFRERMQLLGNRTRIAAKPFGDLLIPMLEKVVGWVELAAARIEKLSDGQRKWIIIIGASAAALGPLLMMVGGAMIAFGTLLKTLALFKGASMVVVGAFRMIQWSMAAARAGALGLLAAKVKVFAVLAVKATLMGIKVAAAWLLAMGPVGWAIAGVALAAVLIVKYWDEIKAGVTAAAQFVLEKLKKWGPLVLGAMTGGVGLAVVAIARNWDKIKETFQSGGRRAVSLAKSAGKGVASGFKSMASAMSNATKAGMNGVRRFLSDPGGTLRSAAKGAASKVQQAWQWLRDRMPEPVQKGMDAIATQLGRVAAIAAAAVKLGKDVGTKIVEGLRSMAGAIATAAREAVSGALRSAGASISSWRPSMPRIGRGASSVPGLATGGNVTRGGSVWVGERGKELLSLPAGARVTPLDHPSMGGAGLTVHVHASDGMSVDQLVDKTIARLGRAASRTVAV